MINPDNFIITRKRKKYKFAKFSNAKNCFEFDEWLKVQQDSQAPVDVIEVGAGTGLFSVELARRHPQKTFAALDVKADRLQKGAYEALEQGVDNIYFIRARADQVDQLFPEHSLSEIWLTFADPFPKKRSAGRRMSHPAYLARYRSLLKPGGSFIVKHDNPEFFQWSLEQLVGEKWHIAELSFDLHESELTDDYKIKTTYEERWLDEGRLTHLVRATAVQ